LDSAFVSTTHLPLLSWAPLSPSEILLWIGDGFTGIRYRLKQFHADTLRGAGRYYVDYPEIVPHHAKAVTAVRVSCEEIGL
jgi:hypothetical protein